MTELQPQELSLEPIRADSIILQSILNQLISHVEFQTKPDANMAFRMLDYYVRIYRQFPDYEIWQVVIHLGIQQVARNLLASGMPVEQIVSITGLTLEEIETLSDSNSQN